MLPQVRAASLTNYDQIARLVGLDPDAMLRRAGISRAALADPDNLIATAPVVQLLEDSAAQSKCQSFGLLMAETRTLASVGAVSLLLMHQGTARDVIEALVKYQRLMAEAMAVSMEEVGEAAIIRADIVGGLAQPQSIELLVGIACRVIAAATGGLWRPESVHFVHDAPDDLTVHRRVFRCPLAFGSDFNGLVCPSASLDVPSGAAEPIMASHAERYLDMLEPRDSDQSAAARVTRNLFALFPSGRVTLDEVSRNLALSPRSLQRLLREEGTSFAALTNGVRRELVQRYLANSSHSITSIGLMLGYSSPSSFTRWFSAEFGVSPAAWRAAVARP